MTVRRLAAGLLIGALTACGTFAPMRPLREARGTEGFFVEFLHKGRVEDQVLPDRTRIQGLSAMMYRREVGSRTWTILRDSLADTLVIRPADASDATRGIPTPSRLELFSAADWRALADRQQKQLVRGFVAPLQTTVRDTVERRVYIIGLEKLNARRALASAVRGIPGRAQLEAKLQAMEHEFLEQKARTRGEAGGFAPVLFVCVPPQGSDDGCLVGGRTYTLILGDQWDNASAFQIDAERRSPVVSLVAGAAFFSAVFSLTIW